MRLREAGIAEARFEARQFLMHAAGIDAATLIGREQDQPSPVVQATFDAMIRERITRRPFQHIVGTTEFYGLAFASDARALVPRSDSEAVVEAALNLMPSGGQARVADLGTGSGCLLAAILANRPGATGTGVDACADAASLAVENLARLDLSARADIVVASWADWTGWGEANLVVSNPPYIPSGDIPGLDPEVREHDPVQALDGGPDGLVAYRELAALGAARMAPGAWLVLEIGHDQKDAVESLLRAAGFAAIASFRDLGGNDRVVQGQKPAA